MLRASKLRKQLGRELLIALLLSIASINSVHAEGNIKTTEAAELCVSYTKENAVQAYCDGTIHIKPVTDENDGTKVGLNIVYKIGKDTSTNILDLKKVSEDTRLPVDIKNDLSTLNQVIANCETIKCAEIRSQISDVLLIKNFQKFQSTKTAVVPVIRNAFLVCNERAQFFILEPDPRIQGIFGASSLYFSPSIPAVCTY
ncbi:hypothetical protein NBRC116601_00380 [Cognatishimia sp. WU-CL00825]|uniref:hypothetical protein n=1 Tax=Cognatishimia sp. WU-CL00825 TaxID=3127658 RepID=UPI00310AB991